jgi:hypothetical protein
MKQYLGSILVLFVVILGQGACTPAAIPSEVPSVAPSAIPTAAVDFSECLTPGPGQALLRNDADGYCLLYPAEYSTDLVPGFIIINPIVGAVDIPGEAWVDVMVEPAAGRTTAQAADKEISDVADLVGLNITRTEETVGGAQAIVVDGLPSFDSVRKVYIVNNDRLYTIWFMPWFPGEAGPTPLEELYSTVIGSLRFPAAAK